MVPAVPQDPLTPPVRPTRLCLEHLNFRVPGGLPDAGTPLHTVNHALVQRAQKMPDELAASALERVRSLSDRVWFKCKTGRWRGACTRLTDGELADFQPSLDPPGRWWLGAGGWREEGSPDDFYSDLEAKALREGRGLGGPSSAWLMPADWDWGRLRVESAVAWAVQLRAMVRRLIATSITSGDCVSAVFRDYIVEVVVRADGADGAFLAITAEGIYDPKVIATILSAVPTVDVESWQPEPGGVSGIAPRSGQIIWSTLLSPEVATEVLRLADEQGQ